MFEQIKPNANKSIWNETRSEINVLQNKYDKINDFGTELVASNKINWWRSISRMCGCANKNTRTRVLRSVLAKCVKNAPGSRLFRMCVCGTFSISKGVLFIFSLFPCVFTFNVIYLRFSWKTPPPKKKPLRSLLLCNPSSLSQTAFVVNFFVVSFAYSFPFCPHTRTHEKLFFHRTMKMKMGKCGA